MADEVVRLKIIVDEDTRGAKRAKKAVDDVTQSTEKLADKFEDSAKEAKSFEERIKDLTAQQAEYARKALEADDVDRRAHIRRYSAITREIGLLHKLKDVSDKAFGLDDDAGLAFRGTGIPSLSLAHSAPTTGGMIATGAAALAPAAFYGTAAVGAGLAGAIGGAGLVAGLAGAIAASIKSPEVQAAAKSFGGDLGATFFGAGGASVKPVQEALAILSDDVKRLGLAELFAKAAPAITIVAGGIGDLVTNLMPGLNRVMDDAEPYAEVLADGFADMGTALSSLFSDAADSQGDLKGLKGIFDLVNGTIEDTGHTVGWLSTKWVQMNSGLGKITGGLEDFAGWIPFVGDRLRDANDLTEQYSDTGEGTTSVIRVLNKEVRDHAVALRLAELGAQNAAERTKNYKEWLEKVNGELAEANDRQHDYYKATLDSKDGLRELKDQLRENYGQWDANTEAGNRNLQSLDAQIEKAKRVRDAQIAMHEGSGYAQVKAQEEYNKTVDALLEIARQAGATKDQLKQLAGLYKVTIFVDMAFSKAASDWSALRNKERQAEQRATVTSSSPSFANVPGFASGGRPPLNTPFWVGENGAELMQISSPARVWSNGQSMAMASASAAPARHIVDIRLNGRTIRELLIADGLSRGKSEDTLTEAYP